MRWTVLSIALLGWMLASAQEKPAAFELEIPYSDQVIPMTGVPGGTLHLGAAKSIEEDEAPRKVVEISRCFYGIPGSPNRLGC